MKLLIVQDQLRGGGTERQSVSLARAWQQDGGEVEMLVFRPGGELSAEPAQHGIKVRQLQQFNSRISLWAPGLGRALKECSPDRIVLMGRTANCYAARIRKWLPEVPMIATVRTGKPLLPWHRRGLRLADRIWVNTAWWGKQLSLSGIDPDRIRVVLNPVAWSGPEGVSPNTTSKEGVCLCVAGFRRGKRQEDLIHLWARWKKDYPADIIPQLWLVGDGPMRSHCERLTERLGVQGLVRFWGWRDDVQTFYAVAQIAVSMSLEDALPNFLIEAQWMGLPVVAVDYAGVAETFIPGETGYLVQRGDQSDFLAKLRRLSSDEPLRSALSAKSREWAHSQFDPAVQPRKILELIQECGKVGR